MATKKPKGRTAAHHRAGYGLNGLLLPHEQAYLVQRPVNVARRLAADLKEKGEFVPQDFATVAAFCETIYLLCMRKKHPLFHTMTDWFRPWLCQLWDENSELHLEDLDKFLKVIDEMAVVGRTTGYEHYCDAMRAVQTRMAVRKLEPGGEEFANSDNVSDILCDLPSLLGPGVAA